MAPSEIKSPLNFADGGAVNWASDSSIYNTQSQLGNIAATPGGFGGMAKQFTSEGPFGMNLMSQPQMIPMSSNLPMQPHIMPSMAPLAKMPPASMAKGGRVENLMTQLREEFKKRGLDFDRVMAKRLAKKGQGEDTLLAHINPDEARMLKEAGGSGEINPHTGLPSFRVDDAPERGSTGSASGASYGGGSSIGSGGGSNQSANAAMGRESPEARDISYTGGGGGGGGDRSSRDTYFQAGQEAPLNIRYMNEQTAKELADANAARIAAERESYQEPVSQGILPAIGNAINRLIGVTPAEAGQTASSKAWAAYNAKGITPQPPVDYTQKPTGYEPSSALFTSEPTVRIDPFEGKYISATGRILDQQPQEVSLADLALRSALMNPSGPTTNFGTGIVPAGVFTDQQMSMPNVRPTGPLQATAEKTIPQRIAEFVNPSGQDLRYTPEYKLPDVGLRIGSEGTPAITTEDKSPFKTVVDAITSETTAPIGISTSMSPAAIQAAQQQSMSKLAAAMANAPAKKTFDEYGATPEEPQPASVSQTIPFLTPVPGRDASVTQTAPAGVLSKIQPVAAGQATVAAPIYSADPNIAALEKSGKFVGGSRAEVAAALGVNPSQLKERIVFYNGTPEVDYYTKDIGQVIGEAVSGLPNLFSGLTTPSVYSTPRGSFVRDPNLSDLFVKTEERKNYGPYGDLTLEEYRKLYGGKEDLPPIVKQKTETETKTETAPETKTPTGQAALAEWSRTRTGQPINPYTYGYGGEYTYFSAKGGHVGPLSKIRK